jgi:tetratricopeptide (TPR) repeat protein
MRKIIPLIFFIVTSVSGYAQSNLKAQFEKGRNYMDEFQYDKAEPIFEALYKKDSSNMNLAYLLGVCYTMGPVFNNQSIYLFEKAKSKMNEDYDSKSELERTTPIHVYYYLAVSYAQSFNFDEATKTNDRFRELIGTINGKYLRDAEPVITSMQELKSLLNQPADEEGSFGWDEGDEGNGEIIGGSTESNGGAAGTEEGGNYGVQIGAFAESIPSYIFSGTENVRAYRGNNGLVRFVVGSVESRAEAEVIRDKLRSSGYADAFLVRLNRKDFMQEVR